MTAAALLSPEWLLLKTCQDLVQRSRSSDLYDKVRMAGMLEQLLIGDTSLAARVNREPAVELELWFREPEAADAARWVGPLGFDASQRRTALGEVRKTGLADFLAARVIHVGAWVTVEQLIRCVGHFYGGMHGALPEGVGRETMMALDAAAREGNASHVAVALHEITGVALRALLPLAEAKAGVTTRADGERARPSPVAPTGSGCPFAGKLPLDTDD